MNGGESCIGLTDSLSGDTTYKFFNNICYQNSGSYGFYIHSNVNLMDEMKKIIRVAKPDLKIFVGESITGNDCTEQAKKFNEAVGIDGIILSKADIDEKGGAAISVSHVTGKPILFLGTGQEYKDLKEFDKEIILNNIGL